MNIIDKVIARIEDYRKENKNPCKSYKTAESAERATAKIAAMVAEHHGCKLPANHFVAYNKDWGRYIGAIDINELIRREEATGGYVGLCSEKGFYSY